MGVEHFTFYDERIDAKLECVIREVYGTESILLPWKLPINSMGIKARGQFAALNDCSNRYRGRSRHVIHVDLDEMIVPRRSPNYAQLMEELGKINEKRKIRAYVFLNSFFYLHWSDDFYYSEFEDNGLKERISKRLLTQKKVRRGSHWPLHKR